MLKFSWTAIIKTVWRTYGPYRFFFFLNLLHKFTVNSLFFKKFKGMVKSPNLLYSSTIYIPYSSRVAGKLGPWANCQHIAGLTQRQKNYSHSRSHLWVIKSSQLTESLDCGKKTDHLKKTHLNFTQKSPTKPAGSSTARAWCEVTVLPLQHRSACPHFINKPHE